MGAFGGEVVVTKGLFKVAELNRARACRENCCRSPGRDLGDHMLWEEVDFQPSSQWLQIKTKTFWMHIC